MAASPIDYYDIVIVGGGLTGVYLLERIRHADPSLNVALLEANSRLGGRIQTVQTTNNKKPVQYEAGGARFSDKHKRVCALLDRLKLSRVPLSGEVDHVLVPPSLNVSYTPSGCSNETFGVVLGCKRILDPTVPPAKGKLAGLTLETILKEVNHFIKEHKIPEAEQREYTLYHFIRDRMLNPKLARYCVAHYEYYSELAVLNMVDALRIFTQEFVADVQYYCVTTGYESIVTGLMDRVKRYRGTQPTIRLNEAVTRVAYTRETKFFELTTMGGDVLRCRNCCLAIPINAMRRLSLAKGPNWSGMLSVMRSISVQPLYRIYVGFPAGTPLPDVKLATNLPLKYYIPIDPANGVVMLSYTDGKFARAMHALDTDEDRYKLLRENMKALGWGDLPKTYNWLRGHYWEAGAGYFKPGFPKHDPVKIAKPVPGVPLYLAGEHVSSHQAWIEGCLETADRVLSMLGLKKTQAGGAKTYTMAEVAKHKKKTDGWLVINGKVYDVTQWIPSHPGGDVILAGLGKDATKLFNAKGGTGHSAAAHKLLAKYKIGVIAKS